MDQQEDKQLQMITVQAHMKPVTDMKFNREGDLIFTTSKATNDKDPTLCVWRTATGELLGQYEVRKAQAGCAVNNASTLVAAAGLDYICTIFDLQSGDDLVKIECDTPCRSVQFNHDDSQLLIVTSGSGAKKAAIHVYNLPPTLGKEKVTVKLNPVTSIVNEDGDITSALWGPTNDTIYFADKTGSVIIHDLIQGKDVTFANPHREEINKMKFSYDYMTLITAGKDKLACLLDSRDLRTIQKYTSDLPVFDASISPINDHVILGGGTSAELVTTTGGQSNFHGQFYHKVHETFLGQVTLHFGTILNIQYHPSGKIFASAGVDGYLKICTLPDSVIKNGPGAKPMWRPAAETGEDEEGEEDEEYEEGDEDYEDDYDEDYPYDEDADVDVNATGEAVVAALDDI